MNLRTGLLNLPNLLTLARVAAIPVVMVLMLSDSRSSGMWAALIFTIAAITDFVDGWLARKWQVGTVLGKFLEIQVDVVHSAVNPVALGASFTGANCANLKRFTEHSPRIESWNGTAGPSAFWICFLPSLDLQRNS